MKKSALMIDFLTLTGAREVIPSRSGKYRQFTTPKGKTIWIGRQGAIRVGQTVSQSVSLSSYWSAKKWAWIADAGDDLKAPNIAAAPDLLEVCNAIIRE